MTPYELKQLEAELAEARQKENSFWLQFINAGDRLDEARADLELARAGWAVQRRRVGELLGRLQQ